MKSLRLCPTQPIANALQRIVGTLCLLLLVLGSLSAHASLTSSIDKLQIRSDELLILKLVLENGDRNAEPDLTPLENDFDVLGTSRSERLQVTNNTRKQWIQWRIRLTPKRTGQLTIPALEIQGHRSDELLVLVTDASSTTAKSNSQQTADHVFLDASLEPNEVFVQQQSILTLQLWSTHEVNHISSASLDIDHALMAQIDTSSRRAFRNNRQYYVHEARYAIFPRKSGRLVIPPMTWQVYIVDRDSYRPGLLERYPKSDEIVLDVKPQPSQVAADQWLPASNVAVALHWNEENIRNVRVGEPINLHLQVQVQDLMGEQIPPINLPEGEDYSVYSEPPVIDNQPLTYGVKSTAEYRFVVVPKKAGTLALADLEIPWWNTMADEAQIARAAIPALEVAPAPTSRSQQNIRVPNDEMADNDNPAPSSAADSARERTLLQLLGLLLLALVIMTRLWWKERQLRIQTAGSTPLIATPTKVKPNLNDRALKQQILEAEPQAVRTALLNWGAQQPRAQGQTQQLNTLAQAFDDTEFSAHISELQTCLYAGDKQHISAELRNALWADCQRLASASAKPKTPAREALETLYKGK